MTEQAISLYELNNRLKEVVQTNLSDPVWVVAEIGELKVNHNGHCYLELIQKDEKTNQIIARLKAIIWAYSFRMIKPYFETTSKQVLTAGIKVLVRGIIEYQEVFGLSFNIKDIDPTYTMGDMARRRAEIINQLQDEGIYDLNKELPDPRIIQRIAIISSPTAAGYEDFIHQLNHNPYNFAFQTQIFPAIMQGDKTEESVIHALEQIFEQGQLFDAVVIVRGGGATTDLASFDSYAIAANICQFPIPVITGIGHDRDQTIVDLVAFNSLKTPTAVAEYILSKALEIDGLLNDYQQILQSLSKTIITQHKTKLNQLALKTIPLIRNRIDSNAKNLSRYSETLRKSSQFMIARHKQRLIESTKSVSKSVKYLIKSENVRLAQLTQSLILTTHRLFSIKQNQIKWLDEKIKLSDPLNILKKGYSITYYNGKAIKSVNQININDTITTQIADGTITSRIE